MHYPRSHTNPLANLVVISSLDLQEHFREIVERDFPIKTLPTLLHEVTHHWCFDGPVGIALHLLFLRARRAALRRNMKHHGAGDGYSLLNHVVRYEAALAMIRPLSEGLALFAEHDAIPGDTAIISYPMQLAASLYARGLPLRNPETPYKGLDLLLAAGRVSREHIRRKADLLIQPMTCDDGGYLPGYLLVKGMWRAAWEHSEKFIDTDFFMQYMQYTLFHDWGLVAILLDDTLEDVGVLDPIWSRINTRLRDFIRDTTPEQAADFERAVREDKLETTEVRTPVAHIDLTVMQWGGDARAQLGLERLKRGLETYFDEWPEDAFLNRVMQLDVCDLGARHFVTIGNVEVETLKRDGALEVSIQGKHLFSLPSEHVEAGAAIEATAELDILSTRYPLAGLYVVLSKRGQIVACLAVGKHELPESSRLLVSSLAKRTADVEVWEQLIDAELSRSDLTDHVDIVRNSITKYLNETLVPLALARVTNERLPLVMRETAVDGLLPLLNDSPPLVLDAAAASLCLPSPYDFRAIESFHRWSKGGVKPSLEAINELLESRLGFSPFRLAEQGWLPVSLI